MNKKAVLFDLDQTLCSSEDAFEKGERRCYRILKNKYPILTKKVFNKYYQKARKQIHEELGGTASSHNRLLYFQRMMELLGVNLDPELLYKLNEEYWKTFNNEMELYPPVLSTMKKIKRNHLQIAILTDLLTSVQVGKLKSLGLLKYIDYLVTSEEAGAEKPNPSIYKLALKKLKVDPEECIFVDDKEENGKGAEDLGISSVLIHGEGSVSYEIKNMEELVEILGLEKRGKEEKKVVVFDFMGTIFKEDHIISKLLHPILEEKGFNVSYEEVKKRYINYSKGGLTEEEFWNNLGIREYEDLQEEYLDKMELKKEAVETIKKIKEEHETAVLSNIPPEWGEYLVEKNNLEEIFSAIILSGDFKSRKPDKEIYKGLMSKFESPADCFYVVDNELGDLNAGKNLLMNTIWLKNEEENITYLPDYTIDEINELPNLIEEIDKK